MPEQLDVAIVGAGPYGLSVAAHLPERRVRVFGDPMHTWRTRMPPDMLLRSDWEETSLSAPNNAGTIDVWAREVGEPRQNPIPLQTFLRYADWFRGRFVRENDPSNVAELDRAGNTYRLSTAAGEEFDARKVVLAVGVTAFSYAPPPFRDALGDGVRFAIDPQDYAAHRGRRVIVVGGGQGGLESAALAARSGAEVELILRSRLHWFAEREPYTPRGPVRQRLYRLAYPVVGYGPPPLNRLALHPELFAFVPKQLRRRLARRILRAGGSPWLRAQVDGKVQDHGGANRHDTDAERQRSAARPQRRVYEGSGRRDPVDRVPLLARPSVLFVARGSRRDRRARRLARPRPLVPLQRSESVLRRLRRRGPLRADLPLRAGDQVHCNPSP